MPAQNLLVVCHICTIYNVIMILIVIKATTGEKNSSSCFVLLLPVMSIWPDPVLAHFRCADLSFSSHCPFQVQSCCCFWHQIYWNYFLLFSLMVVLYFFDHCLDDSALWGFCIPWYRYITSTAVGGIAIGYFVLHSTPVGSSNHSSTLPSLSVVVQISYSGLVADFLSIFWLFWWAIHGPCFQGCWSCYFSFNIINSINCFVVVSHREDLHFVLIEFPVSCIVSGIG